MIENILHDGRAVFITGGAGFIGSHLAGTLLARGVKVITLDNLNDFYNPAIKRLNIKRHFDFDHYTFVEGDIRSADTLEKIFKSHEIGFVIHLAAMAGVRPSLEQPQYYTDVNIVGTQQLLEVMSHYPLQKFIFASSSSVYGNNEKTPFSEDDIVDNQISHYGATKKMGEIMCYPYSKLFQIPTTCLRFFTVYGPRQRPEMAIHKFVRHILSGKTIPIFGDGSTARDYTYIDDIIDGILKAIDLEPGFTVYNLGNSEPVKLAELVEIIEEKTGRKAILEYQELPSGDVLQTFADISRARQRLDYEPKTTPSEGIEIFVNWLIEKQRTHPELYI